MLASDSVLMQQSIRYVAVTGKVQFGDYDVDPTLEDDSEKY